MFDSSLFRKPSFPIQIREGMERQNVDMEALRDRRIREYADAMRAGIITSDDAREAIGTSFDDLKQQERRRRKEYIHRIDSGLSMRLRSLGVVSEADEIAGIVVSPDVTKHVTCYEYEQDGAVPPLGCPTGSGDTPQDWRLVREWVYSREGARIVLGQEHHNGISARAVFHPDNMLERPSPLQD